MSRHFCYEGDECELCAPWVTTDRLPAPIVWPWWLAVPCARLRRALRR